MAVAVFTSEFVYLCSFVLPIYIFFFSLCTCILGHFFIFLFVVYLFTSELKLLCSSALLYLCICFFVYFCTCVNL